MVAASFCAAMVTVTSCAVPSDVSTSKLSVQRGGTVERLHRGVGVVERVGPHPGRRHRVGAEAVGDGVAGRYRLPGVVGIVDVVGIEIAGVGRRAGRAVVDAASLDHVAGDVAGDDRGVVLGRGW